MTERPPIVSPLEKILETHRLKRLEIVLGGDFEFVRALEIPRDYQKKIVLKTIADLKGGISAGRWDVATGGGKTVMALSLWRSMWYSAEGVCCM